MKNQTAFQTVENIVDLGTLWLFTAHSYYGSRDYLSSYWHKLNVDYRCFLFKMYCSLWYKIVMENKLLSSHQMSTNKRRILITFDTTTTA